MRGSVLGLRRASLGCCAILTAFAGPGLTNVAAASELLKPIDARLMRCYPVSTRINHVANDDEECSKPVQVPEAQQRLFQ